MGVVSTSNPTGGENPPTKESPTGKAPVQQERTHTHRRKGKPRASRQKDQRVPQNSYHRSSPYKDSWQSKALGITETNKKSHPKWGDKERTHSQKEWKAPQ